MEVQISAVIITYNESRNIRRCLESLNNVVDEIVVVDSYSTDNTREICQAYNVRFIEHRFVGHIQQKNWAILQTTYPYILSLDADEALSDELRASINEAKGNWAYDGYAFNRLTNYCGKWIRHTSWYPSRKLRLWDSRKGSWGGFNPHDKFFLEKGATKRFLKGDILHYSYYSISEHLEQINYFSTIMARSYFKRGRQFYLSSIILHPLWRFIKDYLVRAGFLDGYYGLIVSVNSSHEVFLKYVKLRNIYKEKSRNERQTVCFFNSMNSWGGGEKWHYDVATYLSKKAIPSLLISTPRSPLSNKLEEIGISNYSVRITNLSFLNPYKVFRLVRIFRKEQIGTLITNLSGDMKIASIAGKIAGVHNIIYRRGSAIPVRNSFINRYLFRKVITRIVANSKETRRNILARNKSLVPVDKISVIYNGVYLPRYSKESPSLYPRGNGEIILGCAGRLSEEKGHNYLLELLKELNSSSYNFKLLIAGEGRLFQTLKKRSRELNVEDQVELLGFVEDMPAFFNSLDIFLLPSHYEGFGYVMAEAMACKLPVIAFDIKSSSEIISDGVTGYITGERNVEEMAGRVIELAGNDVLRKQMGVNGRKRVEELFSFEKTQDQILNLLTRPYGD